MASPSDEVGSAPKGNGRIPHEHQRTPSPDSRTRQSREETTEDILDAAEELFSQRGTNGVAIREIARKLA